MDPHFSGVSHELCLGRILLTDFDYLANLRWLLAVNYERQSVENAFQTFPRPVYRNFLFGIIIAKPNGYYTSGLFPKKGLKYRHGSGASIDSVFGQLEHRDPFSAKAKHDFGRYQFAQLLP